MPGVREDRPASRRELCGAIVMLGETLNRRVIHKQRRVRRTSASLARYDAD